MASILVTGGTGKLGRQVVRQLCYQGLDVGILTTRSNIDLSSGAKVYVGDLNDRAALSRAVEDARVVIHCASNPGDPQTVDRDGTKNLLQCVDRRQIQNFIYVSIAGVDKGDYPYYRVKYEVENIIRDSGLPWSVLRATQFHDLVLERLIKPFDKGDGTPLVIPGGMRFQSIDVRDVANRLQQLALGEPSRSTITIGGPEILSVEDMVRTYLHLQGRKDNVEPQLLTSDFYNLFRSGININPDWSAGMIAWERFLRELRRTPVAMKNRNDKTR